MKRFFLFLLSVITCVTGCSKFNSPDVLELSKSSLQFSCYQQSQKVDLTCTGTCTVISSCGWCAAYLKTSSINEMYVDIVCEQNDDLSERTCVVTVTYGNLSRQIDVNQAGREGFDVRESTIDITSDEQDVTIPIRSNVEYSVEIDPKSQGWISIVSGTKASVKTDNLVLRIQRNVDMVARRATINLSSFKASVSISINQQKGKINDKASNCYLISTPGSHSFDARYIGRTYKPVGEPKSARVIWETRNDSAPVAPGDVISSCVYNQEAGIVEYTVNNAIKAGNAIIAVYSGADGTGDILWSWHIWYVEGYDADTMSQRYPSGKVYMDRNLGAVSAEAKDLKANGLYYQWGRKDPFAGKLDYCEAISASAEFAYQNKFEATEQYPDAIAYSVSHPLVFLGNWGESIENTLWNENIAFYNPCPAGWTLPKGQKRDYNLNDFGDWVDIQARYMNAKFYTYNKGQYLLDGSGNKITWFPGSGKRYSQGYISDYGNESFYFWSQDIKYSLDGEITHVMGGPNYYYYSVSFTALDPSYGLSIRCIKE